MFGVLPLFFAIFQAPEAHPGESSKTAMTKPLSGSDFLLMQQASKHREMKGRDLSCYHIRVFRENGVTTVAFLGNRPPEMTVDEGEWTAITIPGPNPRCPSRSFEMNKKGRVARVVYERH